MADTFLMGNPWQENGRRRAFDPHPASRLDRLAGWDYIEVMFETTHRAGERRISDPGLIGARDVRIRPSLARIHADAVDPCR
jgi:hypothetical protein